MVTGSPGGNTIPGTVMQTIVDVVDFDMNIAEATGMPRIHQEMRSGELRVERSFIPDTLRLLQARGHKVSPVKPSVAETLLETEDDVEGAADPRRPDAAAVGAVMPEG